MERCVIGTLRHCSKKTRDIYSENGVKFKSATYQTNDVKYCLEHGSDELGDYVEDLIRKSIENENQAYLKKVEEDLQSRCCICGTNSLIKAFSAKTSDRCLVCPTCMDYIPTIEPAALKQTKEYIKNHMSEFFFDNTFGYLEHYPSNIENLRMVVNHKTDISRCLLKYTLSNQLKGFRQKRGNMKFSVKTMVPQLCIKSVKYRRSQGGDRK